jgi:hypothetical protein
VAEPVSVYVDCYGTAKIDEGKLSDIVRANFNLTPKGIIETLDLRRPIYQQTAAFGHFGRSEDGFSWEKTDKAEKPAAPQTLAERDAAFRKRQQERAEAERKAAEQAQRNAKLAQVCDDRRTDLRTLESGARISRVEAKAKLSQNVSVPDVEGIIAGLRTDGDEVSADLLTEVSLPAAQRRAELLAGVAAGHARRTGG